LAAKHKLDENRELYGEELYNKKLKTLKGQFCAVNPFE